MASILKVDTIQDQAGNNIINENANVITIGASGDTITIPSGASMSGFKSTGIDDNATSTAITINSSEQVGIGTTSPNNYTNYNTLTLDGTSGGVLDFESNGTLIGEIYSTPTAFLIDSEGAIPLVFRTNSASERMRITSAGNVGIGTSSPSYKLDVPSVGGARLAKSNVFLAKEVTVTNGQTKTIDIATNNAGSYFKVILTGIYAPNAGLWTTHEYEKVYVNSSTGGGNSTISTVYSQNQGNFQFQSGDFAISRPGNGVVRITYTENASNNGDIYLNVNVIGLGGRDVPSAITIT